MTIVYFRTLLLNVREMDDSEPNLTIQNIEKSGLKILFMYFKFLIVRVSCLFVLLYPFAPHFNFEVL